MNVEHIFLLEFLVKEIVVFPPDPPEVVPQLGYGNINPPIRYDTTGGLSPAAGGQIPMRGLVAQHPAVRYDTTGALSAAHQHPPVRYDTTGALSPAHQMTTLPAMQEFPTLDDPSRSPSGATAPAPPEIFPSAITVAVKPVEVEGPLSVTVQFMDFSLLEIKPLNFPKPKLSKAIQDMIAGEYNSGKSCMFPMEPEKLIDSIDREPLILTVYRKVETMFVPDLVGQTFVMLNEGMRSAIMSAMCMSDLPVSHSLLDTFPLTNLRRRDVGTIKLYVRLSCYGQSIVTKFRLTGESKAFLFKNSDEDTAFRCKQPPVCKQDVKEMGIEDGPGGPYLAKDEDLICVPACFGALGSVVWDLDKRCTCENYQREQDCKKDCECIAEIEEDSVPFQQYVYTGFMNPPVRYDTTGALSPAYHGIAPPKGELVTYPTGRYKLEGPMSKEFQHPMVRYDTTGALSAAYRVFNGADWECRKVAEVAALKVEELSLDRSLKSRSAGDLRSRTKTRHRRQKSGRLSKPSSRRSRRRTKFRGKYVHSYGEDYPNCRSCVSEVATVPDKMGWLYNSDSTVIPLLKPRKKYIPGMISLEVFRIIQSHKEEAERVAEQKIGPKMSTKTFTKPPVPEEESVPLEQPTLFVKRKGGVYLVTVQPQEPGQKPLEFSIPGSKLLQAEDRDCDCHEASSGSSVSGMEIEFIAPSAFRPKDNGEVFHNEETQYELPQTGGKSKKGSKGNKGKKGKKGKGKGKSKSKSKSKSKAKG